MSNLTMLLNLSIVGVAVYFTLMLIHFFADKSSLFVIRKKWSGFKEHCVIAVYLLASVTVVFYTFDGVFWLLGKVNG